MGGSIVQTFHRPATNGCSANNEIHDNKAQHNKVRPSHLKSSFRLKLLPMIGISQLRNNDGTNNAGRPEAPVEDKGKAFKKQASDKYLIYAFTLFEKKTFQSHSHSV